MDNLWFPIAILVGAGLLATIAIFVRNIIQQRLPITSAEEREELARLPMTPLQKRAWIGLLIGAVMTVAIVIVIARAGPLTYFEDDDLQLVVLGLLVTTMASYLVVILPVGFRARAKGRLDERDERVLSIAPHFQAATGLVTVMLWAIALTETYRGAGIPTGFMSLLSWSVFVAYMLAHSAGILLGYWFSRNAQG